MDTQDDYKALPEPAQAAILRVIDAAKAEAGRHTEMLPGDDEAYSYRAGRDDAGRCQINFGLNTREGGCVYRAIMTVEDVK